MKKTLSLLLITLLLLVNMLAGCTAQSTKAPEAGTVPQEPATRVVTDMMGRQVTIPADIKSVYCAVPTGEAMVSTLFQDKLIGWVNTPSKESLRYLNDSLANLPAIGGWMGQKVTANMEDIIKTAPDVIIYMGTVLLSNTDTTPNQIQEKTGIPVVVVSSDLADTAYVYRFLGECLGVKERGEQLASYCEKKIAAVKDAVAKVPEQEKRRVYYAEGTGGLATDPSGSQHTQVLDYANVVNVADVEMLAGMGMTEVSIEQVINWNPDVILVSGSSGATYGEIVNNPIWKDIKAVQDGAIYKTPTAPFNWFDRPPNIMRVLGLQWFAGVMYPQYVNIDINTEIKEFFKLFYGVEITDKDVADLLAGNPS